MKETRKSQKAWNKVNELKGEKTVNAFSPFNGFGAHLHLMHVQPLVQKGEKFVAPFATKHINAVGCMHTEQLVAVLYVGMITANTAIIKQPIVSKEERNAPKTQVKANVVFGFYLRDAA